MNIKVIEDDGAFFYIKDDWYRLAQNLPPVQNFDWMYKWWKYCKEGNDLRILVVEEDNKVIGIAPLYVKNVHVLKYLTIKKLCFLGDEVSVYLDFLIQPDSTREAVFQALLTYTLNNLSFDLLGLNDINSYSPNFDLWQKYARLLRLKLNASFECPQLRLFKFKSYSDYFEQLSKKEKLSLKAGQKKIKKSGINVEYIFKKDIKEEDITAIANIHIKRQQFLYEKGISGRFSHFTDTQKINFIRDYFCLCDADSKMLAYMKCNNVVVSYILVLMNKNTQFHWNSAFDSNYKIYIPTKLLSHELIRYAFENNYDYFDFGRGSDSYKLKWTDDWSVNYNLTMRKSLKAKLAYLYKYLVPEFLVPKKLRFKNIKLSSTLPH